MHDYAHEFALLHAQPQSPPNLEEKIFSECMQRFAERVGYIASLERHGRLSMERSYLEIMFLWEQLQQSRVDLGISFPAKVR
jgi:hypothetical protein